MIKAIKKLFVFINKLFVTKKIIVVEFQPILRGIEPKKMFSSDIVARSWFDFIYDLMIQEMLNHNTENVKVLQGVLRDIKILNENGGYEIDFNVPASTRKMTNTSK